MPAQPPHPASHPPHHPEKTLWALHVVLLFRRGGSLGSRSIPPCCPQSGWASPLLLPDPALLALPDGLLLALVWPSAPAPPAAAAAADGNPQEEGAPDHRHGNDQGLEVHCKFKGTELGPDRFWQHPSLWGLQNRGRPSSWGLQNRGCPSSWGLQTEDVPPQRVFRIGDGRPRGVSRTRSAPPCGVSRTGDVPPQRVSRTRDAPPPWGLQN